MSEVLRVFVEPFAATIKDDDEYVNLLSIGVIAWNATLLPVDERFKSIDEMLPATCTQVLGDDVWVARTLIETLMARKLAEFAAIRRVIHSFNLVDRGLENNLSVVSGFDLGPERVADGDARPGQPGPTAGLALPAGDGP